MRKGSMHPVLKASAVTFALALSILLAPAAGRAEEWMEQGEERFLLSAGFFLPVFSTSLGVDNEILGEGTAVNLEQDLGFTEDVATGWFGGSWRFARRHRLAVSYFRFVREVANTVEREIAIGDEVYPAGATLDTRFAIQTVPITYSYSFLQREKYELAGSLGVHWWVNDLSAEGSASLGGQDGDASAAARVQAPLPLLGLIFAYRPGPRWEVDVHAEALVLNIDADVLSYSGSFVSLSGRTHYWFYNQLGVGGAVNWFDLDFDVDGEKWRGKIEYDYVGPQIYLVTRF